MQIHHMPGEILLGTVFEQVAARAATEGRHRVDLVAKHRDHHHISGRVGALAVVDHVKAGPVGQSQVHQQHVWRVLVEPAHHVDGTVAHESQFDRRLGVQHLQ